MRNGISITVSRPDRRRLQPLVAATTLPRRLERFLGLGEVRGLCFRRVLGAPKLSTTGATDMDKSKRWIGVLQCSTLRLVQNIG
jgi:hypothetical protein